MQTSYKEIFYGVTFGLGAAALDTFIDARITGDSFLSEIAGHPGMMIYRILFVIYGLLLGWVLWKNNQREREIRRLMEDVRRFHHEYESHALVLHTNLQTLLTKGLSVSPEAEALIRSTYEKSRELQALAKERPEL